MLEESINNKDLSEIYHENQYKDRFGIEYSSSRSTKGITRIKKYASGKNIKKIKINRGATHKNYLNFKKKSSINKKKKIIEEVEEIELNRIYKKNNQNENDKIIPIENFNKVSKCSIIKYGIKKSTERIEYSYCKTCDHNLVRPICLHCINKCHSGHATNFIFKKGRIKCSCGEKNHYIIKINYNINIKNIICLGNEWNITSKLGFYYINKKNKPICILCHNYCESNNKKDKIIKLDDNKTVLECSCKNEEIHGSHRAICEKIINLITDYNEFYILLHPIQFINMLFKSCNNFKYIFEDFEIFNNNLNNDNNKEYFLKFRSIDIANTNIYKTLLIFEKLVQKKAKNNYIYYYNEKVLNYFSFNAIKSLYSTLEELSLERSFRIMLNKYLYLFHKLYINYKTQILDKYKLADLKNLSFLQRSIIFNNNKDSLKEVDDIVLFLLKIFRNLIYKGSSSIESFESAKEIIAIFRKLSCYNIINNELMTKICITILKYFNYIRIVKSNFITPNDEDKIKTKTTNDLLRIKKDSEILHKILFKIYYMIMKMIMNFIYNYNDNLLNDFIFNKEKYPDINSITLDNVCFLFKRNELGRFIYEINISILSNIFKDYDNYSNKKLILTKRIGMEIFHYSLNKADNYYLNIFNSINQVKYYYKNSKNLLLNKNQYYKELIKQCNLLSNAFDLYFNFGKTIEEMLEVANNSLNFVLGELAQKITSLDDNIENGFNFNQKLSILCSNFFSLISRVIGIIHHYQNRNKVFNDKRFSNNIKLNVFIQILPKKIEDEIIKKILYFYSCFVYKSPDNSLLILSHTIFIELTKLPIKYCQFVFKLFLTCIKNILDLENINVNYVFEQRSIIKRLYNYLETILEDKSTKESILLTCIHYFLQILEIIIFNSYSAHSSIYNNFIYKIQYILIVINQKYNLINKFFEIKENEFINKIKLDNRSIDLKDINPNEHQSLIMNNNENDKNNSLSFEFYKRNILQKSFVIYIKLINDCFDFSIPQDVKKIEDIINVNKVIFALKNYKINLDLRTEFLRLLRKILLDIRYSDDDNNIYTMNIINKKDNLYNIKDNQLINNMDYPTRLLSFVNNFYNTSAKIVLKEKIKRRKNINNNKRISYNVDKSDISDRIENKNYSSINNDDNSNKKLKAIMKKDYKIYNSNYENLNIKNRIEKNYTEEQEFKEYEEEFEKEKSFNDYDSNTSGNKSKSENKDNLLKNGIILEESNPKLESDLYKSTVTNNKSIDKEENDAFGKRKIKGRINLLDINKKTTIKNNIRGGAKRSSCFFNQNFIIDKKTMNNLTMIPNQKKTVTLKDESEIDSDDIDNLVEILEQNDEAKFYSKCKDINILEEAFNDKFYDIIDYELDNIKRFIENIKIDNPVKIEYIRNYIENGILIPTIFYFKRIFNLIHFFTGNEMIKIFSLLRKSINLKLFISSFNIEFWKNDKQNVNLENDQNIFFDKNEMINSQNFYFTRYRNSSILDGFSFNDKKCIDLTKQSLYYINSNKISIFDFSSLYQIIEKEFFSLIKDRKKLNILETFKEKYYKSLKKKEMKNEEKLLIEKNKGLLSELQKRLLKVLIIYKYSKLACFNEINSSFLSVLPEITLGYETNFRNLLINILIFYGVEKSLKNEFIEISYFILFKLLSIKTIEIQNDIINILGGKESENPGFLKDFNNNLFSRIILLFINYLNPPDNLIQSSYFISCNLIYIFKMLCEEHNIFFQKHFIKSLSYSYIEDNSIYFRFSKNKENDSSEFSNSSSKLSQTALDEALGDNNSEFCILFYDFFLFLQIKIMLISNWDYKNNYIRKNPFLYDLFISILDLLNEIIQGSDYELMSSININLNEKMVDLIKAKEDNENYEYIEQFRQADSFEFFIKNIKSILFEEKNNYNFINEIRINLIHFITSILEEKNSNSIMKKYIKKYVDINNIYKIIGIMMKSYYLNKEKPNNFDKIKKSINLMSSTKFIGLENNNNEAPLSERRRSHFNPIFRGKMNILNSNNKSHNNNTLNTLDDNSASTSNIKLMNSTIIHRGLRKKLTQLNLDNRIEFKLFKTISTTVDENNETSTNNKSISIKEITKTNNNNNKEINKSKIKKYKAETVEKNSDESIPMEFKITNLIFGKKLYNYFKDQFYENLEFTETLEFKLSNSFYRYIKIILFDTNKIESKVNIDQIKKVIDIEGDIFLEDLNDNERFKKLNLKDNLNYEKDALEKYYIQKFFEDITKIIEIRTDEGINKQIIYTKLPIMKFLSKETKKQFQKSANRDNETTKKNDLMKYIEYFIKEINYFKKNYYKWDYVFSKIDFKYMILISYLFALFYNLLLLLTIKGDNTISGLDKIKGRRQNELKINKLINNSVNQWSLVYKALDYINLILNIILIMLWILYKLPLYYKIDQIKYKEIRLFKNKKLSFYDKIYILFKMGFFDRNYISMLIYELIVNTICVTIKKSEIIYAFLLLPILFINRILKNIMISIRLNYHQFLLTFFFGFILAYVFSNFYFFFLNSDFYAELNYHNDNYCKTLAFAFLTALDGGLRARGGMGDLAKRISYSKNKKHYLFRVILDDLFFLSIVIIMIDMIFGIIIKSFDVLRHRNQKYRIDKKNYCYICHSNRDSLEKSRLNFKEHINITHNLWNYVEYMISLKLKDIKDLNNINKYVREKIDKKDITWLPTYKDIIIKKTEHYYDFDENNFIIFAENFCNYKIKSVDYD